MNWLVPNFFSQKQKLTRKVPLHYIAAVKKNLNFSFSIGLNTFTDWPNTAYYKYNVMKCYFFLKNEVLGQTGKQVISLWFLMLYSQEKKTKPTNQTSKKKNQPKKEKLQSLKVFLKADFVPKNILINY